jgi:site-specific recombinase XerC
VLRHTFATTLLNQGAEINAVKEFVEQKRQELSDKQQELEQAQKGRNFITKNGGIGVELMTSC